MDLRARLLYHQIHPLKLLTDWGTAAVAAWLLWDHRLGAALLVGFVPPILVTAILVRWADLEPYRDSSFGRYVARHMTRAVEGLRLAGLAVAWGAAWAHRPLYTAGGVAIILGAWAWGLVAG